jgi:sulfite reductase beta subunit-like hemoprotein
MGLNAFRTVVFDEREVIRAVAPAGSWPEVEPAQPPFPPLPAQPLPQGDSAFNRWAATNVIPQKQPGYAAVYLTVPGGDLSGEQARGLARLTRAFARGEAVITISQNLVLRWVAMAQLPILYRSLAALGLHAPGAERLGNPVGCAGADTCPLAITASHQLAHELARRWAGRSDWWLTGDLAEVQINISGCPNACGQHHLAPIGLYGASRKINGQDVPHYNLLMGGRVAETGTQFGQPVARIPARRVPEALEALVNAYRQNRRATETFLAWVDRLEQSGRLKPVVQTALQPFLAANRPDDFTDWGQQAAFTIRIGANECAA